MENRINVAELLKDCPEGMELDCSIYNKVTLLNVDDREDIVYPIRVFREDGNTIALTKYGQYTDADFAKCVIFPKGKTTWEVFHRPFKDGDIISNGRFIAIFHKFDEGHIYYHCWYNLKYNEFKAKIDCGIGYIKEYRYATKEEKAKLFKAIKDNGYKWNPETKSLEKLIEPKFKAGDVIQHKENSGRGCTIRKVEDRYYVEGHPTWRTIPFDKQDEYKLVINKFDITTLKPFQKVLVRDYDNGMWCASIFSHTWRDKYFCICIWHNQCIPYEGNEYLLGTTDDCDEYYKNW